jgi:hypothetical protein
MSESENSSEETSSSDTYKQKNDAERQRRHRRRMKKLKDPELSMDALMNTKKGQEFLDRLVSINEG